jgi:glycosyltransferase involved in cell wall biosynthesis
MVGRLSIQKNPLLAVKALALIKEKEWLFEVIGHGPLDRAIRELAEQMDVGERVTLHGWIPSTQVAQLMAQADILLLTSLHEGLPLVAIEALQYGLAIVGSQIPGLQDIVEEGENGFLCELSPESFAQKLGALLSDPRTLERMRRASYQKAGEFDLEKTVTAYEGVLSESSSANSSK